jgi:hypothetical protein
MSEQKVIVTDARNRAPGNYHDAVINGVVHTGIMSIVVYVTDETELSLLNNMPVGTIAMSYGLEYAWQLNAEREWLEVGGAE